MITAERIATTLAPDFLTTVQVGEARPVRGLELLEPDAHDNVVPGDLVVVIGARADDVPALVDAAAGASGLVLRAGLASDAGVRERAAAHGLTVLALADDAALVAALTLLRDVIDRVGRAADHGSAPGDVYGDLFAMADTVGAMLDAPVTIEDARSRVLAYSTGQRDVDAARTSTIIGRRVPREVRDHLRARGVFRHLATSDEPLFVPADGDRLKPRLVLAIRAGGEWLGAVWAVVDAEPPAEVLDQVRPATDVLALHLLRLRALGELDRHLQRDQVRALVRGEAAEVPDGAGPGPWRVVALSGPRDDIDSEERATIWAALAQRHGWRHPVLADLDGGVYAVVADSGSASGSWGWLAGWVAGGSDVSLRVAAGRAVDVAGALATSTAEAAELLAVTGADPRAVVCVDRDWAPVVLSRALAALVPDRLLSPVTVLAEHDAVHGEELVATLCAVLDHWGEPQRAARALGVHPNTVRNRLARLRRDLSVDLEDPAVRLGLRLEAGVVLSAAGRPQQGRPVDDR